jgi:NDP-sugar pyrophosphorylase family protein
MTCEALVAAGGFGTRMSNKTNPLQCKSLIEYAGQPLIGHLIDSLKEGGIKKFVFSSGNHNFKEIERLVRIKQIDAVVVPYHGEYRKIPYIHRELLGEQFLFVCGHQPLTPEFVSEMIKASRRTDSVITSYDNLKYPIEKEHKILFSGDVNNPTLTPVDTRKDTVSDNHKYIRNPYIVKKRLIKLAEDEGFKYTFSYYIYLDWKNGGSLSIVESSLPPEFDNDNEFQRTKDFLNKK